MSKGFLVYCAVGALVCFGTAFLGGKITAGSIGCFIVCGFLIGLGWAHYTENR